MKKPPGVLPPDGQEIPTITKESDEHDNTYPHQ